MKNKFYIYWMNEYSKIVLLSENSNPLIYSGPFKSLNEAKTVLIDFLNTKLADTKNNLQEIRALKPEDFRMEEEKDDL